MVQKITRKRKLRHEQHQTETLHEPIDRLIYGPIDDVPSTACSVACLLFSENHSLLLLRKTIPLELGRSEAQTGSYPWGFGSGFIGNAF